MNAFAVDPDDVASLACPSCQCALTFSGKAEGGVLQEGQLTCKKKHRWPVRDGLLGLVDEAAVRGPDSLFRMAYDRFAPLHDLAVDYLLPVLQGSSTRDARASYMKRIGMAGIVAGDGERVRVLDVGAGSGANFRLLEEDVAPHLRVDLWGVDLSEGMLREAQRNLRYSPGRRVRLLRADAHALPFPDDSFDRVFHVGGIGSFRDPAKALADMARVARPRTPIVVVDEQLDTANPLPLLRRLAYRGITFGQKDPRAPVKKLPANAMNVRVDQISPFYYCLSFRMP